MVKCWLKLATGVRLKATAVGSIRPGLCLRVYMRDPSSLCAGFMPQKEKVSADRWTRGASVALCLHP